MCKVCLEPLSVKTNLVHTNKTDGREVVLKRAEVALGVRIKSFLKESCNNSSLDLERTSRNVHDMSKTSVEVALVFSKVCDSGHIDGNNTDRTCAFTASEESARLLAKLTEVKTQTAAHTSYVAGLHIAVDVVREVRSTVLCGHLEEKTVVFGIRPVKVACDGVGGDRILESASVVVTLDHDLDKRLVYHIHLSLTILVLEVHIFAADDSVHLGEVSGNLPVKRDVGEGRLSTPTGGGVYTVNKGLYALLYLIVSEVVHLYEGSEVGIKGRERLSARPLVLHDSEEVYHLVAESREVRSGGGGYLTNDTAKTFLNELLERPTSAVSCEHREVVNVNVSISVSIRDLLVIYLGEPVVSRDSAGVAEYQSAYRVGNGGVFLNSPVYILDVAVDQLLVVKNSGFHITELFSLLTVENISLCHVGVARLNEDCLNAVLNILHSDKTFFYL